MGSRRPPPFSLRLTFEERAKIEADAAGMSLGGYIRSRLLDPDWIAPRRRGKFPVKDHRALAQLLAMLGQSRLANNVNQLAKAANTGRRGTFGVSGAASTITPSCMIAWVHSRLTLTPSPRQSQRRAATRSSSPVLSRPTGSASRRRFLRNRVTQPVGRRA